MDAREAYHRRAYRVALLLTDSDRAARRVLEEIARLNPRPERSSDARFDRAVLQACRPIHERQGRTAGDGLATLVELSGPAAALWTTVQAMDPQSREAWVLRDLEGLEEVRAAIAMDCSRNAMEKIHLLGARRHVENTVEDAERAHVELTLALDGLDPTDALAQLDAILQEQRRRSRLLTILSVVLLVLFLGALTYVLVDLLAWNDGEDAIRGVVDDQLSNPMPTDAAPADDQP